MRTHAMIRAFVSVAVLGLIGTAPATAANITVKGSDTMVILAQRWAETYMKKNPAVTIQVTGGGSGTGIAALINKTTNLANSSRPIKGEEIAKANGNSVDPGEYNVRKLAFDPWRFAQASQELERQGMTVVEFAQTDVRMCPASQRLRDAIVEQRLVLPADQGARAARRRRDQAPQPPRLAPGPPDPLDHDRRCRRPGARARTD